jgi:hypothetical protein
MRAKPDSWLHSFENRIFIEFKRDTLEATRKPEELHSQGLHISYTVPHKQWVNGNFVKRF